jgi:hypothetical protein
LDELFALLTEKSGWEWLRRDGDQHGEYISALANPDRGMVRVYVEPDHYVFDVEFDSRSPQAERAYEDILRAVREELLPAVGAREVRQIEGYGR